MIIQENRRICFRHWHTLWVPLTSFFLIKIQFKLSIHRIRFHHRKTRNLMVWKTILFLFSWLKRCKVVLTENNAFLGLILMFIVKFLQINKVIEMWQLHDYGFWQRDKNFLVASTLRIVTQWYLCKNRKYLLLPFECQKFEIESCHWLKALKNPN